MQAFILHDDDDKPRITYSVWMVPTPPACQTSSTPLSLTCSASNGDDRSKRRRHSRLPCYCRRRCRCRPRFAFPGPETRPAPPLVFVFSLPGPGFPSALPCPRSRATRPPSRLISGENHAAAPSQHPWIGSRRMTEVKGCKNTRHFKTLNFEVDRGIEYEMKRIFHRFRHYPACAVDGVATNLFGLPKLSQPSTAPSTASTLSGFLTASHEPDEMRSELGIAFVPTRSSSLPSSSFSSRCHIGSSWQRRRTWP